MLHAVAEPISGVVEAEPEETEQDRIAAAERRHFAMQPGGGLIACKVNTEIVSPVADLGSVLQKAIVVDGERMRGSFGSDPGLLKELPKCRGVDVFADLHCAARNLKLDVWKVGLIENQEPVAPGRID